MESAVAQPKWKVVEYTRSQIINAGKTIRRIDSTEDELKNAVKIVDNWRAAHAFPLHIIYTHLRRMRGSRTDIIVA